MAYNSYFPVNYQPYQMPQYQIPQYQGQSFQQSSQMQTAQQTQPGSAPVASSGIIWVSGYKEAANYPVAPNNAVTLWDSNASVVYMKKADQSGKPDITVYDLVERPQENFPAHGDIGQGYATKNDLEALAGVVQRFDEVVKVLNEDVEAIQAEMAKRKRPSKKSVEVETDDE